MNEDKLQKYNNPFSAVYTGIVELFRKYEPAGELKPGDRLDGKTVVVDGASSGLGFAVATENARRGARVVMACRSGIPGKGEQVKKLSGNDDVHMLPVDFTDFGSIGRLVTAIREKFAPIDILVCNSGVVTRNSRMTPAGFDEMFQVNYLSKFYYINRLLSEGVFRNDPVPRIVIVASESHRNPADFAWDTFGQYRSFGIGKSVEMYGFNKLYLATFSRELSRRLNPGGKTRYSVLPLCPGPINSGIAREAPKIFHPLMKLVFGLFFRTPEKAAVPVIYLAASPDLQDKPFDYLFLMNRKAIDPKAEDPANGKKIWEMTEELLRGQGLAGGG
jgi:NAD(P)-dependent dehydrogenase (short-subunit alcohol dehydrogenase family)